MDITDSYDDLRSPGKTIGTISSSGILRQGIDIEKAISVDNGALRFQPLIKPGWGRQGIAYGEYTRANGLAFAVLLLNGHNTSQVETIEWLNQRLSRWVKGSETESVGRRILGWLGSRQKSWTIRRLLGWMRIAAGVTNIFPLPKLDENLAVGWFPNQVPADPLNEGNGLIVHATGAENGELWARVGNNLLSVFKGLQNIQVYYVIILREQGAVYYAASVPNVANLVPYPQLRPLAIDPFNQEPILYAGVHQSTIGQIGFRADTRVYGVQIKQVTELATWYGTAHAADRLVGEQSLADTQAEVGGKWLIDSGSFLLTARGLMPTSTDNLALIFPTPASGLIHLLIETSEIVTECSLVWRWQDQNNYWCCRLSSNNCQLRLKENGSWYDIVDHQEDCLKPNAIASVQIVDDGELIGVYLNGNIIGDRQLTDSRLQDAIGIGIGVTETNSRLYFRNFEAHPRAVSLPTQLDFASPWWQEGTNLMVQDDFQGSTSNLSDRLTTIGNKKWRKEIGKGIIAITDQGTAKVQASSQNPNPGRTAYTIDWENALADVEVEIIPPGTQRGKGEKGRGGLIFWQDADNYIIINTWLDDFYEGESISSFFRIDGFEEVYDAVWSNIGNVITFGQPYTLRIIFDGNNYCACVNGQTVLYRALTDVYPDLQPLKINRLGIVANWEWGNDTGSAFSNFVAKS
jgi:hypothetical protein